MHLRVCLPHGEEDECHSCPHALRDELAAGKVHGPVRARVRETFKYSESEEEERFCEMILNPVLFLLGLFRTEKSSIFEAVTGASAEPQIPQSPAVLVGEKYTQESCADLMNS